MKIPSQFRDAILIGGEPAQPAGPTVEVCRSFSYKMNLANYGGAPYESVDLFSSRKMQTTADAAAMVSESIFEECVAEVRAGVVQVAAEIRRKKVGAAERITG